MLASVPGPMNGFLIAFLKGWYLCQQGVYHKLTVCASRRTSAGCAGPQPSSPPASADCLAVYPQVGTLNCRLGVLPAEQAAPLKLLEKGVSKEALAGLVLLEFPCELLSAVLAGR